MGNKQSQSVADGFRLTCHSKLRDAKINSDESCLELHVLSEQEYLQWKWNIYPLAAYYKYLLLPIYFNHQSTDFASCQPPNPNKLITFNVIVGYEPFIYTLRNEIHTRKLNHTSFTQKQVFKILKTMLFALKSWLSVYDNLQLGPICPQNIVFDSHGHIKVTHLFSFPPENLIFMGGRSYSYFDINPLNKLSRTVTSQQQKNQNITKSLNQIANTCINIILIEEQKKQNILFSSPSINFILQKLSENKTKSYKQLNQIIDIVGNAKQQ